MATRKRRQPYHVTVALSDLNLLTLFEHYATSEGRSYSEAGAYLIAQGLRTVYTDAGQVVPLPLQRFYEKPPKTRIASTD